MLRFWKFALASLLLWLLAGVYIVGGNERGVVRRFGKAIADSEGHLVLKPSGLHWDWPWPFSRVDRINLNEIHTLIVPAPPKPDPLEESRLLGEEAVFEPAFLTGDKNLLNVRVAVHFRISASSVEDFLYGSALLTERLSNLTESSLAGLLTRSGVDFAQLSGRTQLRRELLNRLQLAAEQQSLGLSIEEVAFDEITPPVQVKADFLDVANARADREQIIQTALSLAEQRKQSAEAEARSLHDAAQTKAQETLQAAQGSAARFRNLIGEWSEADKSTPTARQSLARRLALERYYHQTVTAIMKRVEGKIFLDTGQPVDLTIWGKPKTHPVPARTIPQPPK